METPRGLSISIDRLEMADLVAPSTRIRDDERSESTERNVEEEESDPDRAFEELQSIEIEDEATLNTVDVVDAIPMEIVSAKFGTIRRSVENHWQRIERIWDSDEFDNLKRGRRTTRLTASQIFSMESKPNLALLKNEPQFRIERCGVNESYFVELLPTRMLYRQVFHQIPHLNIFCQSGKDLSVVTIELEGDVDIKKALILTVRRGYQTATVSLDAAPSTPVRRRSISLLAPKKEFSLEERLTRAVQSTWFPHCDCYLASDPQVALELLMLEREASDNTRNFRLGVCYAKKGQELEAEFFANSESDCSPRFWEFMNIMGDEIDMANHKGFKAQLSTDKKSYYVKWREWEIMYHLAPFLNSEEQRRLIGNDTAVIYFHDSDEEFNTSAPRSMMTQLFLLVQPLPDECYRVASFCRNALARYPPELPPSPVFDASTDVGKALLQDFLLAKTMNGFRTATSCSPLNKLFQRPRQVRLQNLAQRFPLQDAKVFVAGKKKD